MWPKTDRQEATPDRNLQKRPAVPFVAVVFQPLIFLLNDELVSLWVSVKHLKTSLWAFFFSRQNDND